MHDVMHAHVHDKPQCDVSASVRRVRMDGMGKRGHDASARGNEEESCSGPEEGGQKRCGWSGVEAHKENENNPERQNRNERGGGGEARTHSLTVHSFA